jgi:hypothetical protein
VEDGKKDLADAIQARLELYQADRAYREPLPARDNIGP